MSDDGSRDQAFGEALANRLALAEAASRIMQATDGADGRLRARRILEVQLDAGPGGIAEWVYRQAAAALHSSGHEGEALALRRVADTSSALAEAEQEWHGRYLGRPLTEDERRTAVFRGNGVVLPWGPPPVLGTDGAVYQVSSIAGKGGKGRPSVTVTGHAGASEAVMFPTRDERDRWYAARMIKRPVAGNDPVPLWTGDASVPDCRTVREERVLACLLRGGSLDAGTRAQLQARTFTTYARSEIYLAWLAARRSSGTDGAPAGNVRQELARRMLRAPASAARYVGWPFGHQAVAYFDRLTATPSAEHDARASAGTLIADDAQAVAAAARARPGSARVHPARQVPKPRPGDTPDVRWRVPQQRCPDDPSAGPAPRL